MEFLIFVYLFACFKHMVHITRVTEQHTSITMVSHGSLPSRRYLINII